MAVLGPLDAATRQARSLEHLEHRPWPLPRRGWALGQTWEDLLFAHWRVPLAELREHVPTGLEIDTFDDHPWLGVAPFRLSGLRPRRAPPLPRNLPFLRPSIRT